MQEKISVVKTELSAMDKEILALNEELHPIKRKDESVISQAGRLRPSDEQRFRLFQLSIAKKPVIPDNDSFSDDIVEVRKPVRIKGYVPPQRRIYDTIRKKEKKIEALRCEEEERLHENCPFEPTREARKSVPCYSPGHLLRPKKVQPPNEGPKRRPLQKISNDNGIYARQQMKSKVNPPEQPKSKQITEKAKQELLERLTTVRKNTAKPVQDENPQQKKTVAQKATIERLVAHSVPKPEPVPEDDTPKWSMDPESRRMVRNIQTDVYEEGIKSRERREAKMRQIQAWQEAVQEEVVETQKRTKPRRVIVPEHCEVAGLTDHIERMSKSYKTRQDPPVKEREYVAVRPFACYHRQFKLKQQEIAAEQVLADIEELLHP